jgi:hypothetical protein
MLYLLSQLRTLEFISARGWDKTLKIKQQLEEQWLKCLLFLFLLVIDTDTKSVSTSCLNSKSSIHDFDYQPSFIYLDFLNFPISLWRTLKYFLFEFWISWSRLSICKFSLLLTLFWCLFRYEQPPKWSLRLIAVMASWINLFGLFYNFPN